MASHAHVIWSRAGRKVLALEQYRTVGGMTVTEEETLPGFWSDLHASGYQLANLSPVPHELGLPDRYEIIEPEIPFSHASPNVYLCSSGSHPGPGVSMAPGRNAAQVILSDLGLDFRSVDSGG